MSKNQIIPENLSNKIIDNVMKLTEGSVFQTMFTSHQMEPFFDHQRAEIWLTNMAKNRMAWKWAETQVEIRGTLADARETTK